MSTAAVFLPSFVLVVVTNPWVPRLRHSALAAGFLDAVNSGSVGLMAAVAITPGRGSLVDPVAWVIGLAAGAAVFRFKAATPCVVLGGAAFGWGARALL